MEPEREEKDESRVSGREEKKGEKEEGGQAEESVREKWRGSEKEE